MIWSSDVRQELQLAFELEFELWNKEDVIMN